MKSALEGTTVLDFTRHMYCPYGTLLLGDFGADVIKLEPLLNGDPTRKMGTAFIDGESVTKPNKKTSMIFKNLGLLPWRSVAYIAKGVYP